MLISGDRPNSSLNHIYLRDLNVHSAAYHSKLRSDSGEAVIATAGLKEVLNDVLVDGVSAHDTTAPQGISISAGGPTFQIRRKVYSSFAACQAASHQDARSRFTNPLLADPTYRFPRAPILGFQTATRLSSPRCWR